MQVHFLNKAGIIYPPEFVTQKGVRVVEDVWRTDGASGTEVYEDEYRSALQAMDNIRIASPTLFEKAIAYILGNTDDLTSDEKDYVARFFEDGQFIESSSVQSIIRHWKKQSPTFDVSFTPKFFLTDGYRPLHHRYYDNSGHKLAGAFRSAADMTEEMTNFLETAAPKDAIHAEAWFRKQYPDSKPGVAKSFAMAAEPITGMNFNAAQTFYRLNKDRLVGQETMILSF